MTKQKERIPIDKLQLLSEYLGEIKQSVEKMTADSQALNMEGVLIEGWPTLARGIQFVLDQSQKFVGSASKLHELNGEDLLLPGQSYSPTKKQYTPRAQKQKEIAESTVKPKSRRNNKSN